MRHGRQCVLGSPLKHYLVRASSRGNGFGQGLPHQDRLRAEVLHFTAENDEIQRTRACLELQLVFFCSFASATSLRIRRVLLEGSRSACPKHQAVLVQRWIGSSANVLHMEWLPALAGDLLAALVCEGSVSTCRLVVQALSVLSLNMVLASVSEIGKHQVCLR